MDLVSCFMNKNVKVGKEHKDQRESFTTTMEHYDWNADHLKLKGIKEAAEIMPDSTFVEPNFIAIKNGILRCMSMIETCVQSHDYARCDEFQKLINDTEKCLKDYCRNPEGNVALLEHV